ncbi:MULTISPECIES: hypothetical protein [unclassified Caballeronia]|uniref:hypothetical protein n=1 Tax=unclassified Caballeronia TaxID=2646786 RepID=UPI001F1A3789|nr:MULTISPECIES: hypothetical protein [unclassified Caballeronia]MCE4547999.1 hypothetical protein [Caballeronia sp. PC1]MCE4575710.1 hypothetical protein [Caballeronia sp. CLC5]
MSRNQRLRLLRTGSNTSSAGSLEIDVSNKTFRIPKYGGAESAFLGVEFKDTYILIVSVFVALVAGKIYGTGAYLGIPFVGYHANKKYIEWRSTRLPGFILVWLYRFGLRGFSKGFKSQRTVYVGDATVINPASDRLLSQMMRKQDVADSEQQVTE